MGNRLSDKEIQNLIYIHKSLKNKRDADKVKCLVLWSKVKLRHGISPDRYKDIPVNYFL
ncbi:MAG TPA: hypothetical protein PLE45_06215 [Spirochaetota bacterium]|nr:hypothetical protein [Spirochaetota bacterium]HPP03699.1 hypothetical protein [Spirochaetota bacterium]